MYMDHPIYAPTILLYTSIPIFHEQSLYIYHGEIIVQLCKSHKRCFEYAAQKLLQGFVSIKYERPTALYRWKEMYYYADFDWPVLFKIQSLQFKFRYIPFKENLHLWGKESSAKCRLCNEIDNGTNWQEVSKLIQRVLDINIRLYDL